MQKIFIEFPVNYSFYFWSCNWAKDINFVVLLFEYLIYKTYCLIFVIHVAVVLELDNNKLLSFL